MSSGYRRFSAAYIPGRNPTLYLSMHQVARFGATDKPGPERNMKAAALARWMTSSGAATEIRKGCTTIAGAQMCYLEAGQGPPVVLLHGLLGTAGHWEPMLSLLAGEAHVYAPDALGIGASERVHGLDTSLPATADRLAAFLDACGIDKAHWVGSSHGGAVAMVLAARHPDRVHTLVLHAPVNPFCHNADPLVRFYNTPIGTWFAHCAPRLPDWGHNLALRSMYGDASRVRQGSLKKYMDSLRVPGTIPYVLSILRQWNQDRAALEAALPALRAIPALLLWGDRDRAVSRKSGDRLQRFFDHVTAASLPGAGHLPHEEVPEAFAAVVRGFLRQQTPAQAAIAPIADEPSGPGGEIAAA